MIDGLELPVGSCVKVKNYSKTIMIAGYLFYDEDKEKMYDYIGIYPPIGIREPRENLKREKDYICFDKNDIETIIYIGFSDSKSETYIKTIEVVEKLAGTKTLSASEEKIIKIIEGSKSNNGNPKSEG